MPETPRKKRSGYLIASPETKISAASKNPVSERNKKKKKYQFVPIDSLENNKRAETNVLRSISVSQVRNSGNHLAHPAKVASRPKKAGSVPPAKAASTVSSASKSNNDTNIVTYNLQVSEKEETPSEKVIWEYYPIEKDASDQFYSSHDNSEDLMGVNDYQDPSSTPMVPKRLKSVLNFANISEREKSERESTLSAQQRDSIRSKENTTSLKENLRDIDDILGDIEGDIALKPKIPKVNELPSSPSGMHPEEVADEEPNTFQAVASDPANDDDESLIEILTQKLTQRNTNEASAKYHSDSLDDSLLDHFDFSKEGKSLSDVEEEIGDVGIRISQALKMTIEDKERLLPEVKEGEENEYIKLARSPMMRKGVKRFAVLHVNDFNLPKVGRQKVLSCVDGDGHNASVVVRHPWVYLEIEKGDVIHIVEGKNIKNKRLLSDDKNPNTQLANDNLLILNPDILLSATSVGSSVECLRRAVLQMTLDDPRGEPSLPMIIGNIVHELLQNSLKYKLSHDKLNMQYLEDMLDSLIEVYSFEILQCNKSVSAVKTEIRDTHVQNILEFTNKFVQKSNYGCYVSVSGTRITQPLSISNIFDIEENIWSPIYGLKGFLDATVEAHSENDYSVVPLEVKTGKHRSLAHETQGLIYNLLLSDRYEVPSEFFLLLYTRNNEITKYPRKLHSVKHVLMFRNQMANQLKYQLKEITSKERYTKSLPPILQNSICDSCSAKQPCMVLNKLLEEGTSEESGLKNEEYEMLTGHLQNSFDKNRAFLEKYIDLIRKEESSISGLSKEIFLMDSKTRESLSGRCISNLAVSKSCRHPGQNHLFLHTFIRKTNNSQFHSMLHSQLSLNDMVIISDEAGHFSLCQGRITAISSDLITVSTRRRFLNNCRSSKNDTSSKIDSVVNDQSSETSFMTTQNLVSYRIDKNDIQNGLKLARFNLLNIFLSPVIDDYDMTDEQTSDQHHIKCSEGGDERMRAILVDGKPPGFQDDHSQPVVLYEKLSESQFNADQLRAIDKVMRAKDYSLILGMPGTGKTTVIAEIIKLLVAAGKTVLLASYTHSAVDNILLKLMSTDLSIVRLGVRHRIAPRILKYYPNYDSIKTYDEFLKKINEVSVVATTCLGINDYMFTVREKDFDYVILDEASQISMPVALGPIRYGKKFIMVGDHYQLPPLVKNDAARSGGLEESLFKMLCDKHKDSISELTYQYRMCEDIASLSNFLIYDGKLKCGNSQVSRKCLHVPNLERIREYETSSNTDRWLEYILDPKRKVIFLNYDKDERISEGCEKDNITNEGEIEIICQCLEAMTKCGVDPSDIGVMTLYRAQLNLFKKTIPETRYAGLETLTADQFQGRDKECIIISMVRKNDQNNSGSLLKELRRVNVAMTRAKSKLVIIGSKKTISSTPDISNLMGFLERKKWIYELTRDFRTAYKFPSNVEHEHSTMRRDKVESKHVKSATKARGVKNITANSKIIRDKPIIRQTLSEF